MAAPFRNLSLLRFSTRFLNNTGLYSSRTISNACRPKQKQPQSGHTKQKFAVWGDWQQDSRQRFRRSRSVLPLSVPLIAFFGLKKAVEPEEPSRVEDDIILSIKHARLAEMKGEFDRAERFYHQALSNVTEHQKKRDMSESELIDARVTIYDSMANLALSQGEFSKAESLYKETMRGLLETNVAKSDNSIIEISLKLAMIYAMQQKYKDAETGYAFCIDTQETKLGQPEEVDAETVGLLGMCLNSYSRFLMLRGRSEEAAKFMARCVDIGKRTFGDNHPQVAVLLSDLATMRSSLKEYGEATKLLQEAIYIAENTSSPDLPILYCNLGEIHLKMENLEKAKETCELARSMAVKFGDEDALKSAKTCLKFCKDE